MTDKAIAEEIGTRVKRLRLRKNRTQEAVAERAQLSVNTIKALESGRGKLSTIIAVLRELDSLDQLDHLIPDPGPSPLELVKLQGKQRQRAGKKSVSEPSEKVRSEW